MMVARIVRGFLITTLIVAVLVGVARADQVPPKLGSFKVPPPETRKGLTEPLVASMTVAMKISKQGVLIDLSYVSSDQVPESRKEEFLRFFRGEMARTKITPATEDGTPVPALLTFTFHWYIAVPPGSSVGTSGGTPVGGTIASPVNPNTLAEGDEFIAPALISRPGMDFSPDESAAQIDAPEKRTQLLQEIDQKARELMTPGEIRVRKNPQAILVGTINDQNLATFILSSVTGVQAAFNQLFKAVIPADTPVPSLLIYQFPTQKFTRDFKDFTAERARALNISLGRLGIIATHTDFPFQQKLRETLIVDTGLAMIRQLLFRHAPPTWLLAGISEYLACSDIDRSGQMQFGIVNHSQFIDKDSQRKFYTRGVNHLQFLILHKDELSDTWLDSLVSSDNLALKESADRRHNLFVPVSFVLVNQLLGTKSTGFNQKFFEFLRDCDIAGDNRVAFRNHCRESFIRHFGPLPEVEAAFWNHLKDL